MVGDGLEEFACSLTTELEKFAPLNASLMLIRIFYPRYFETKLFLHSKTLVGRLVKGARLELTARSEHEVDIGRVDGKCAGACAGNFTRARPGTAINAVIDIK